MCTITNCITEIDGKAIDDVEDLDLVMSMYNFLEYSSNYSDKTGSLWFYSKDELTYFNADNANNNAFKSFNYKVKLLENTVVDRVNGILVVYLLFLFIYLFIPYLQLIKNRKRSVYNKVGTTIIMLV